MRLPVLFSRLALLTLVSLTALGPGCGADPAEPSSDQLRRAFPEQAARVLEGNETFVPGPNGFTLHPSIDVPATPPAVGVLRATLPRFADRPITIEVGALGGGVTLQIRERGASGEITPAGEGLRYASPGGSSFWSASDEGLEEWLHLDAGLAHAGKVIASWDVEGASLRQQGDLVEIVDAMGIPKVRVTAPAAWAKGGRPVVATLAVHGASIDLSVDADGDAVLVDPSWTLAAQMVTGRTHFAAVLLTDGSVLVAGGRGAGNTFPVATERYFPLTNTWSPAGSLTQGREWIRATPLPTVGKVLATGGQNAVSSFANADLYDPVTNVWTPTTAMPEVRSTHTQTTLNDGRVLVANGNVGSAILYDPATALWTATGAMNGIRQHSQAMLFGGTRVLVVAGNNLKTAEVYDVPSSTWTLTGSMAQGRVFHRLTTLPDGRILATGGLTAVAGAVLSSTEIYDPATGLWAGGPAMTVGRQEHTATLLPNGTVLVTGGPALSSTEIYDPVANTWTLGVPMNAVRISHSATLLQNGSVFVVSGGAFLKTTEYYSEGLGSSCQTNVQCPSGFCADGVCCDAACNAGACDACSIAAGGSANGTCVAVANGTACNDADGCTQTDTCQAGVCTGSNPVVCGALDACHGVGVCDSATGMCTNPLAVDGTACNDGNACTQTDTCQAGACSGANPVVCAAQDQCHNAGICAPATGVCSNPNKANGTACNDGDACTQTDTCQAGACSGANPVVCAAQDQCHNAGICAPATGVCSNPNKANGTACNDGSACTQTDTCQAGACSGANPVACAALDACHVAGVCAPATGLCSNPLKPNGTACDDANPCTVSETCAAGVCGGGVPGSACLPLDSCHTAGVCSQITGLCSNPVKPDGAACDDGNACTQVDTCAAGACVGASPISCKPLDVCHLAGVCDPVIGACTNPPASDGIACDDGDACTQLDSCAGGACAGGSVVLCAPIDACHDAGACDPATGACSTPAKEDGASCDDGSACTMGDMCTAGVCKPGPEAACVPSDGCHDVGVCDPATGVCSNPLKALDCSAKGPCEYDGACDPDVGDCVKSSKPDGAPCPGGECIAGTCVLDPGSGSGAGAGTGGGTGSGAGSGTGGGVSGAGGSSGSGGPAGTTGSGGGTSGTTEGCGCEAAGAGDDRAWPLLFGAIALLRRRRDRAAR